LLGLAFAPQASRSSGRAAAGELSVLSFGARGDDDRPDTAAIQAAVDALRPGETLAFPPGDYLIDTRTGVRLKDGVRLDLGRAVLRGPNVDGARCRILHLQGAKDVEIRGGTLVGSRGGSPEWGVGVLASDAEGLLIEGLTAREFYFDGILLTGNRGCRNVVIRDVVAEDNRRTGLAIVHARDVTVERSTFRGSRGQSPEAGVNCEPNPGQQVRNVAFEGCSFLGNAHAGLYVHPGLGQGGVAVSVSGSVADDNGYGIIMNGVHGASIVSTRVARNRKRAASGIVFGEGTKRALAQGNVLDGNLRGILVAGANDVAILGNSVTGPGSTPPDGIADARDGIVCLGLRGPLAEACVVAGNTVRAWPGSGLVGRLVTRVRFLDNVVGDVGRYGVHLQGASESEVRGNAISGTGRSAPGQYGAVEVAQSSSRNRIAGNSIQYDPALPHPIGICGGCPSNVVVDNTLVPR
jgi:nitrous oxidase accessory protein NosD